MNLKEVIKQEGTTVVDVREPWEYQAGTASGAINIPLGAIPQKVVEFQNMSKPIVVFCRSGIRSAQAMGFLMAQGIKEIRNGGGLHDVLNAQNKETA